MNTESSSARTIKDRPCIHKRKLFGSPIPGRGEGYGACRKITGAKSSEASLLRKRRCSGMSETWPFQAGARDMELAEK